MHALISAVSDGDAELQQDITPDLPTTYAVRVGSLSIVISPDQLQQLVDAAAGYGVVSQPFGTEGAGQSAEQWLGHSVTSELCQAWGEAAAASATAPRGYDAPALGGVA